MNKLKRYSICFILHFIPDGFRRAVFLKKRKVFAEMGNHVYWHPRYIPSEPENISIGNNVQVTSGVVFITHDIIGNMLNNTGEYHVEEVRYSTIKIGDNVSIGGKTVIMPGTVIENNVVVSAGSVVKGVVSEDSIIAGNPAKKVCSFKEFAQKREGKCDGK